MLSCLLGLFRKRTVNSILAGFNKAVEDLNSLAVTERQYADEDELRAAELYDSAMKRRDEASRAAIVADRILMLVSA
jgi:hypothetical protein